MKTKTVRTKEEGQEEEYAEYVMSTRTKRKIEIHFNHIKFLAFSGSFAVVQRSIENWQDPVGIML